MKVFYEIDTAKYRAGEMRKSLSYHEEASSVAVKLTIIKKSVQDLSHAARVYNKFTADNE